MNDVDAVAAQSQPQTASSADGPLDSSFHELKSLLDHLQPSRAEDFPRPQTPQENYENDLAEVRLGTASGLFMSLRAKHAATAAHSVRVAMGCSAWGAALELSQAERDIIEVA